MSRYLLLAIAIPALFTIALPISASEDKRTDVSGSKPLQAGGPQLTESTEPELSL
jgi:hypothetical protein